MDALVNTASTRAAGETPVGCTTTASSSINFGKVGMRYFHKLRNKIHCPIVNIAKLWWLIPQEVRDKASKDNAPLVDVTQFGYFKVLGKGMLPENKPVVVKAKLVSKIAEKKIKRLVALSCSLLRIFLFFL